MNVKNLQIVQKDIQEQKIKKRELLIVLEI